MFNYLSFNNINFIDDIWQAIENCDLMVIATEWNQYRTLDLAKIKKIAPQIKIVDLRNILDKNELKKHGFIFDFIGNKN